MKSNKEILDETTFYTSLLSRVHNTVYHESFVVFCMSAKLLYEILRWCYSDMDLREVCGILQKFFCEGLHV